MIRAIGVMIMLLSAIAFVGLIVSHVMVSYQYERILGSYMETATDTITPESFKEQLLAFKAAINTSGLTEDDYGAWIFKKPDNSMKFQIQHIDSIIGRADAMLQWKNTVYNNGSQTLPAGQISAEAFRDVYNDKMNNLRTYIHAEGYRSDWIAQDAWYVKYHLFYYFWVYLVYLLLIIVFSFGLLLSWVGEGV